MILVDANVLIYAHHSSLPQHETARSWLDAQLSGAAPVGLPWVSLLAFIRLITNPRIYERSVPAGDAWRQIESWLDVECVWVPGPMERHREILGPLVQRFGTSPNLIPDCHLAALAIEHGLTLCSADGDFARFTGWPGFRWENPLLQGDSAGR